MKLSELLFGKKAEWQSDADHEAGKPLAAIFWLVVLVAVAFCLLGWAGVPW
jgi:hypothetical protein